MKPAFPKSSLQSLMDTARQARIALTCLKYVRDASAITRGEREAYDAFIPSTIGNASATILSQANETSVRFATAESPAPDEVLRPISVNALAQALGMPFETVRRRVKGLTEEGLIESTPAGVVILSRTIASPAYTAMVAAHFERARRFYWDMKALDALLPAQASSQSELLSAAPPIRVVSRAVSDYFLRFAYPMIGLCGGLITAAVLAEVVLGATKDMDDTMLARWVHDAGASGHPIKLVDAARPIRISRETARRHSKVLQQRGLVAATRRGLVATAPVELRDRLVHLTTVNLADARRFFATLGKFGVLTRWEADLEG